MAEGFRSSSRSSTKSASDPTSSTPCACDDHDEQQDDDDMHITSVHMCVATARVSLQFSAPPLPAAPTIANRARVFVWVCG